MSRGGAINSYKIYKIFRDECNFRPVILRLFVPSAIENWHFKTFWNYGHVETVIMLSRKKENFR